MKSRVQNHVVLVVSFLIISVSLSAPPPPPPPGHGRFGGHGEEGRPGGSGGRGNTHLPAHGQPHPGTLPTSGATERTANGTPFLNSIRILGAINEAFKNTLSNIESMARVFEINLVKSSDRERYPYGYFLEVITYDGETRRVRIADTSEMERFAKTLSPQNLTLFGERTTILRMGQDRVTDAGFVADSVRGSDPLLRALGNHMAGDANLVPETAGNRELQELLRQPELFRSVRFHQELDEITIFIEHAALPGRRIEIIGRDLIPRLLRTAGMQSHPVLLARMPVFYLSNPTLGALSSRGNRTLTANFQQESQARHRQTPADAKTPLAGNEYQTTHLMNLSINPQTGFPDNSGTAVSVRVVSTGAENQNPHTQNFSAQLDGPAFANFTPAARHNFQLYLSSLNRTRPETSTFSLSNARQPRLQTAATGYELGGIRPLLALFEEALPVMHGSVVHEISLVADGTNSRIEITHTPPGSPGQRQVATVPDWLFTEFLRNSQIRNPDFNLARIPGRHLMFVRLSEAVTPAHERVLTMPFIEKIPAIVREIGKSFADIAAVKQLVQQNPALGPLLENPHLGITSIRFSSPRRNHVEMHIEHAAIPGRTFTISGVGPVQEVLTRAGATGYLPTSLAMFAPTFYLNDAKVDSRSLGARVLTSNMIAEAEARHRTTPTERQANATPGGYPSESSHRIGIDPQSGAPAPGAPQIEIRAQTTGPANSQPYTQQRWTVAENDPNYRALSPAAKALFDAYLNGLNRN